MSAQIFDENTKLAFIVPFFDSHPAKNETTPERNHRTDERVILVGTEWVYRDQHITKLGH